MEFRAMIEASVTRNDRTYRLILPVGAPFEECYDVLGKELKEAIEFLEKQAKDQAAQQQSAQEPIEATAEITD